MTESRVFVLLPVPPRGELFCMVITPELVGFEVVQAAWSYALNTTPKSLYEPDYEAALELMKKRHPRWEYLKVFPHNVNFDKNTSDKDVPDKP